MSHPRLHAATMPDKPAVIMADGSARLTFGELEDRANRGAQLIRALGIAAGDSIAFWLPNCPDVFEVYWAGQRCGVYITPIAHALTAGEADYILDNAGTKLLVGSPDIPGFAGLTPRAGLTILTMTEWRRALAAQPSGPITDEAPGYQMVYSSGTTGRPKGVRVPLPEGDVTQPHIVSAQIIERYALKPADIYFSPAPLYHAAPLAYTVTMMRLGGSVVQMPRFDAESALAGIERYRPTITQMVPTMFVRMLKLPEEVRCRYDLSSLRILLHAAAPCPIPVKQAMIDWLGPIVHEYYAGSESNGTTIINSADWLRKPGSVGRPNGNTAVHICDESGIELPPDTAGTVYFSGGWDFRYHGDEAKTRESRNPLHPDWSTLGDVGYVDSDGFLFLTDRKSHMIISGGVNIYPQEAENLLITHPRVADAAVIGVPDADFGEAVKAVVQPLNPADATPAFAAELIAFCRAQLSPIKCPRSVDFDPALPREDNGKLYKRKIKARYWPDPGPLPALR